MGIVNVTPDSFSDGGRYLDPASAIAHGCALVEQGAEILDLGGESTRPGAEPVPEEEELHRVLPVIRGLRERVDAAISIDTLKPAVARAALEAGASVVNDVHAGRPAADMLRLVAETGAGYVAMHMQGEPRTMQRNPTYRDVVNEVHAFFRSILERSQAAGVHPDQIALDVGIGFGKGLDHNLELLANMAAFRDLSRPLLVGVSRKSFIAGLTGAPVAARLPGSIASACLAVAGGAAIVRTHDVDETAQALQVDEAIRLRRRNPVP